MASAIRRLLALAFVGLLATATITFAADTKPVAHHPKRAPAARPSSLLVPDVRGKAYVFAEGMLEEAGFAWRVSGSVEGYAANTVVSQSPAAGTKVADTGAPLIVLQLRTAKGYRQVGVPDNVAPFPATAIRPAAGKAR